MRSTSTAQEGPSRSPVATAPSSGPELRTAGLWRDIPRDLSVAWLAIAPLYVLGPSGLPEPIIALAVGTAVGLASAVLKAGIRKETAEPHPPWQQPQQAHSPPQRKSPSASTATFESMPGDAVGRPPTADQLPVAVPPRPLDFDSYGIATPTETQCPHCGSFDTERTGAHAQQAAHCHTCHHGWSIDDGAPPPDVVVRSWLSHRESAPE